MTTAQEIKTIYSLLKFGEESHMKDLFEHGRIYMNTLAHFGSIEKTDHFRKDSDECTSFSFPADRANVELTSKKTGKTTTLSKIIKVNIRLNASDEETNAFSCYAVTDLSAIGEILVDKRMLNISASSLAVVAIHQPKTFIKLIFDKLKELKLPHACSLVEYVDRFSYEGEMGPSRKYSDFSYQNEFRIISQSGRKAAIDDLYIGSIEEIASFHKL